jgi:hypothetical protein
VTYYGGNTNPIHVIAVMVPEYNIIIKLGCARNAHVVVDLVRSEDGIF